jgi:hypothetical protein
MFGSAFKKTLLYGTTMLLGSAFACRSLLRRGRATHTIGIGLSGTLKIVKDPPLPFNGFFRPSREFSILVRHATALRADEMERDFRSMAIKLSTSECHDALDLVMNTGHVQGFWHGANFLRGAVGGALGEWGRRWYIQNNPPAFENVVSGIRRSPSSFEQISYYAAISFDFFGLDGSHHLVRFRTIPGNRQSDSGVSSGKDLEQPWHEERDPEEDRGCYWLSEQARARIRSGKTMNYVLQVQIRPFTDDQQAYNIGREWDPSSFPWQDLAHIQLDRLLDPEATEAMTFRIDHQPSCLAIPNAESPWEYRSIGWMRPKIYSVLQRIRKTTRTWRRVAYHSTIPAWDKEASRDEHEWRRPHSFTTLLPITDCPDDLIAELTQMGKTIHGPGQARFSLVRSLHFVRMQVVSIPSPYLLIDLVHDRSKESHLDEFLLHLGPWLEPLLRKHVSIQGTLRHTLLEHEIAANTLHTGDRIGKATDVLAEQRLREVVDRFLDANLAAGNWKADTSAETIRRAVRSHVLSLSDPSLPHQRRDRRTLRAVLKNLWHASLAIVSPWSGLLHQELRHWFLPSYKRVSLLRKIGAEILLAVHKAWTYIPTQWFLSQVRKMEQREAAQQQGLGRQRNYDDVIQHEERLIQNPLTVIGDVQDHPMRRWLLGKVLAGANDASSHLWDRGELAGINTIHCARIFQVQNGTKLIFLSDYDGSWARYLSDFLTVGATAVVPIFSHLVDCPPTKNLFETTPGFAEAFRTFIRNYQEPVHLWFSAWPHLSLKNRLANARLRDGLFVEHMSESHAQKWATDVL